MPLNSALSNGDSGDYYVYFTTIKIIIKKKNGQGRPPKGEAYERPLNEEGALGPVKEKHLEIAGTSAGAVRCS